VQIFPSRTHQEPATGRKGTPDRIDRRGTHRRAMLYCLVQTDGSQSIRANLRIQRAKGSPDHLPGQRWLQLAHLLWGKPLHRHARITQGLVMGLERLERTLAAGGDEAAGMAVPQRFLSTPRQFGNQL
jgi:hypothetical protein